VMYERLSEPDFLVGAGQLAEELGFASLWLADHVVVPSGYASAYPYNSAGRVPVEKYPEPLISLALLAGVTKRIELGTAVLVVPQRNPVLMAKQIATLDAIAPGRVRLGVGAGWLREEFDALGANFADRGARTDEYIAVMRKLWAEDGASFAGQFVNFDEISSNPKPVKGTVPIVIGGHSEAAAKRAGRLGDGFFPSIGSQVDTVPLFDVVRRAAEAAGRDPKAIEIMAGCPDLLPGSTKDPRAAIEARAKQGVGRIVLPVWRYLPDLEDGLGRFGETVIRQLRA